MITINLKSESKHPIPNSENKQKPSVTPNTPNAHTDKNNLSSKDNKVVKSHGEKLINTNHAQRLYHKLMVKSTLKADICFHKLGHILKIQFLQL